MQNIENMSNDELRRLAKNMTDTDLVMAWGLLVDMLIKQWDGVLPGQERSLEWEFQTTLFESRIEVLGGELQERGLLGRKGGEDGE